MVYQQNNIFNSLLGSSLYTDWFLPSKDELDMMYQNLYLAGVGGFTEGADAYYWSSSEYNVVGAWDHNFSTNTQGNGGKGSPYYVRACRKFTAETGLYSLRNVGRAGGLIFHVEHLDEFIDDYYEASKSDTSDEQGWSNITSTLINSTMGTAIGTGLANTILIINQAGHTSSAAKLCNDLEIYY